MLHISAATLWARSDRCIFSVHVGVFYVFLLLFFCSVLSYCDNMHKKQAALAAATTTIPSTITTTDTCNVVALHCRHIQIETMLLYVILLWRERSQEKERERAAKKNYIRTDLPAARWYGSLWSLDLLLFSLYFSVDFFSCALFHLLTWIYIFLFALNNFLLLPSFQFPLIALCIVSCRFFCFRVRVLLGISRLNFTCRAVPFMFCD